MLVKDILKKTIDKSYEDNNDYDLIRLLTSITISVASNFDTPTEVAKLYGDEFWDRIEMLLECDLSDEKLVVVLGDNLD